VVDNRKYILRKLAERVGVPRESALSPKQGFAMAAGALDSNELRDLIMTTLLESRTLQRGYFNPAGVRQLLDEHFRGRRDHSGGIWRLLIFELCTVTIWKKSAQRIAGPSLTTSPVRLGR